MKINIEENKSKKFKDVPPGDLFAVNEELYVKINETITVQVEKITWESFYDRDNGYRYRNFEANAISIRTGEPCLVSPYKAVKMVKSIDVHLQEK